MMTRGDRASHGRERRERRRFVRRSGRRCFAVCVLHSETRVHRIRTWVSDPQHPEHTHAFVWTNPMEVMEEGRRMRGRRSMRSVYPLRLRQLALCFLPGLRPHEHRSFRQGRRRLRMRGRGGRRVSVRWRIPSSWSFFVRFSDQWEGLDAMPRLTSYRAWWTMGRRIGVILMHRPRRRRRWVHNVSSDANATYDLNQSRSRLVSMRRPLRFGAFVLGALRTPPDVRSQRRVAMPLVFRVERCILMLCVQRSLRESST